MTSPIYNTLANIPSQNTEGGYVSPRKSPIQLNAERLDLKTIFSKIGENVCCVYAGDVKSSGILLGGKKVLVTLHSVAPICGQERKYHEFINIQYGNGGYLAKWSDKNIPKKAEYYDCCVFDVIDDEFPSIPEVSTLSESIDPGEEVYFAGYPLTQEDPSFHKGTVSSYTNREGLSQFHIDASILPGNSGGPVFIVKDKALYLAGMIFAELASIDSDFVRKREDISSRLLQATISAGGVETNKVVLGIMNTVFDNLSTGIGKVLSIQNALDVTTEKELPDAEIPFHLGFSVGGCFKREKTKYEEYDTYPNGHESKHFIFGRNCNFKSEKIFAQKTVSGPSKFFPEFSKNYISHLKASIERWVDNGANKDCLYVGYSENIGADNGELTNLVEIYFTCTGGAHIRPKYIQS